MASPRPNEDLSLSPHLPHSRAALALAHLLSDPGAWDLSESTTLVDDPAYFKELLKDSSVKAAWDNYTNLKNVFPQKVGDGTLPFNGYRHYMGQDAIYLQYYVQVRLEAIIASGEIVSPDELSEFAPKVKSGLDYAVSALRDLERKLGVPPWAIRDEWHRKSTELQTSIAHYETVVKGTVGPGKANPYTDIYFALLPCIKGYFVLAKGLLDDPKVLKNTLYYTTWIKPNSVYSSSYDKFLEKATIGATTEDWKRWRAIFKTSCANENNFFKLATEDYKDRVFNIIRDGSYTISPFGQATQFLTATGTGVVAISKTGNTKWEFKNGVDGYTIMNVATKQYLNRSAAKVETTTTPAQWPINPIYKDPKDPKVPTINGYHLFAPGHLNLVLEWSGTTNLTVSIMELDATGTKINNETWVLTKTT